MCARQIFVILLSMRLISCMVVQFAAAATAGSWTAQCGAPCVCVGASVGGSCEALAQGNGTASASLAACEAACDTTAGCNGVNFFGGSASAKAACALINCTDTQAPKTDPAFDVYGCYTRAAARTTAAAAATCFTSGTSAIYQDIHDGDMKQVNFNDDRVLITPHGNNQTWAVTAKLDRATCSAVVDFRVPHKPSPPPCALSATFLRMVQFTGEIIGSMVLFTDPSGTLPAGPLNSWIVRQG